MAILTQPNTMLAIFAPSGDAKDTAFWTFQEGVTAAASELDQTGSWSVDWYNAYTNQHYGWKFASAAFRNAALVSLRQSAAVEGNHVVSIAATGVGTAIASS